MVSPIFIKARLLRQFHPGGHKDGLLLGAEVPLQQPPGPGIDPGAPTRDTEALRVYLVPLPEAHAPRSFPVREEKGQIVPRGGPIPDLQAVGVKPGFHALFLKIGHRGLHQFFLGVGVDGAGVVGQALRTLPLRQLRLPLGLDGYAGAPDRQHSHRRHGGPRQPLPAILPLHALHNLPSRRFRQFVACQFLPAQQLADRQAQGLG